MNLLFILAENTVKGSIVLGSVAPLLKKHHSIEVAINKTDQKGTIQAYCDQENISHFMVSDSHFDGDELAPEKYDCVIVCGWGWLISKNFISRCKKIVNYHSSLHPDYRGASAYIHYWANCESQSGVTIHVMTPKFDAGRILLQKSFPVSLWCSTMDILRSASKATASLLLQFIDEGCPYDRASKEAIGKIRYFRKMGRRAIIYRAINFTLRFLRIKYRVYTPHLTIKG